MQKARDDGHMGPWYVDRVARLQVCCGVQIEAIEREERDVQLIAQNECESARHGVDLGSKMMAAQPHIDVAPGVTSPPREYRVTCPMQQPATTTRKGGET